MESDPPAPDEARRVLILAPGGRDAAVVQQVLAAHAVCTTICESEAALVENLERGAAAAFVLEEGLSSATGVLTAWIGRQPPWSDFPFVVLVARRSGRRPSAASGALKDLGNVVLLERPLNGETLVTAALSALRARTRQYAARRYILEEAQARVAEEKARAEVLVAKQTLEVAVDAGELGTFHCPSPFTAMQCSRRCWEHFGLPADGWLTLDRFYSIVHVDDRELVGSAVRQAITAAAPYEVAFRTIAKSGEVRWIRAKGRVYGNGDRKPQRFDGVTFDITRQKLLEEEREGLLAAEHQARLEAEKAGRMKDEFLATLSHELRTPLSAILGWTYLLGRPSASAADVAKAASTIERNARAQARLIEELLDISRITSGNLKLQLEPVSVTTVFDSVVQSLRPALQAKDIAVETTAAANSLKVLADAGRLQQVVWNLVANAIKFTDRGGRVALRATVDRGEMTLTVSDSGIGIAPEFLPHVFERFRQAESTEARSFGGLGLGLAIVRQLVELHGGSVSAHSDGVGQGARFEVRLPAIRDVEGGQPITEASKEVSSGVHSGLAGVRLLLVDDEVDGREMLARVLFDCGAQVEQAGSAEAALKVLEREAPNLLISDVGMPQVDGYEFIRRVRRMNGAAVRRIPAIALTAFARPEDFTKARRAGFDAYLTKPVDPTELVSSILSLTGQAERPAAPAVEPGPTRMTATTGSSSPEA